MKKKTKIKTTKRKGKFEMRWLKMVKNFKHALYVGRWVVLGAALMWCFLVIWK